MKKPKDTPTIAAAKRVLATANVSLQSGGKAREAKLYQDEACASAPRLARRLLVLERSVRRYEEMACKLGEENKKMRAWIGAGPVDISEVLGEEG